MTQERDYKQLAFIAESSYGILRVPTSEQPLERLERVGTTALSLTELISIIIGSGSGDDATLRISRRLLSEIGDVHHIAAASTTDLQEVKGVGRARAGKIKAALELGRRLATPTGSENCVVAKSPADIANLLIPDMQFLDQEHLKVLLLNTKSHIKDIVTIYVGNVSQAITRPAEVFKDAIRQNMPSIVLAHNHPSGDPTPSSEDVRLTKQIVEVGRLLEIDVLDHLIIGRGRFVSLKELSMM